MPDDAVVSGSRGHGTSAAGTPRIRRIERRSASASQPALPARSFGSDAVAVERLRHRRLREPPAEVLRERPGDRLRVALLQRVVPRRQDLLVQLEVAVLFLPDEPSLLL